MAGPTRATLDEKPRPRYDGGRLLMAGPVRSPELALRPFFDGTKLRGRAGPDVILNVLVDAKPPVFAGLSSVGGATPSSLTLSWTAATDVFTDTPSIVYDIYQAPSSGGQDFLTPTYSTIPGATSYVVTGLEEVTTYYFVVRARDLVGNRDTNTVEAAGTTEQGAATVIIFG